MGRVLIAFCSFSGKSCLAPRRAAWRRSRWASQSLRDGGAIPNNPARARDRPEPRCLFALTLTAPVLAVPAPPEPTTPAARRPCCAVPMTSMARRARPAPARHHRWAAAREDRCLPPCIARGCRCNSGAQNACGDGVRVLFPDNPGLAGGPGHCVRAGPVQSPRIGAPAKVVRVTAEFREGVTNGLIYCADHPSTPGGPGRCEDEQVCFTHQCQATTNPCPERCSRWQVTVAVLPPGHWGNDGHCGAASVHWRRLRVQFRALKGSVTKGSSAARARWEPATFPLRWTPVSARRQTPTSDDPLSGHRVSVHRKESRGYLRPGSCLLSSQMTAPNKPGGPGMCAAPAGCGNASAYRLRRLRDN